ncbi:NlpC/P60 family protein [Nakamurella flava]|uniref:NlpC/P60 family protein n=1 Tax=Nakamurella flava TaxID=2576308 RepID=A0A4U6QJ49_9ACTN|nr:C40 family peptidase [Nakamurella flava]TKV60460.1 NlpC/P60 family protein [Nakamurella flava]
MAFPARNTTDVLPTCPRSTRRRLARYRSALLIAGTVSSLGLGAFAAGPALADPTTAADAQQAYLDSEQRAGQLNEQVLSAQENEQAAAAAAAAAGTAVDAARQAATDAQSKATEADAAAGAYKEKVDSFANASFRGARFDGLAVLLTADSADDYLDQVSSLDQVADDTRQTLDAAQAARAQAAQAQADASAAQTAAEQAKSDADAKAAAATQATQDVTARKAELDAEAQKYRELYNSLSEQERAAAEAAAQAANEAANRAAAEAAAAAAPAPTTSEAAAPAQAPAAANRSRTLVSDDSADTPSRSSSSSAAPTSSAPAAVPAGSSKGAAAVAAALSKVGSPYVYGAAGPNSFDCSGLTSWAWAQAGVTIPRTSSAQAGLPSVPLDQLQPGDLVTYYSPVSHVAMYIGNGQVVHASTETKPVYVTSVNGAGPNATGHRVTG